MKELGEDDVTTAAKVNYGMDDDDEDFVVDSDDEEGAEKVNRAKSSNFRNMPKRVVGVMCAAKRENTYGPIPGNFILSVFE